MKHLSKLQIAIVGVALVAAVGTLIFQPTWGGAAVAVLTVLGTFVGLIAAEKKAQANLGRGGSAIRTESTADLHVDNQGIVSAGSGGTGGNGGDAIHVANGVKVTIINKGVIAGGNAGNAAPSFTEKWVDLRYPHDSGLQERLESAGYKVAWCLDTRLSRLVDLEGWKVVTEPDEKGIPTRFRLKDKPADQILIMKRSTNG